MIVIKTPIRRLPASCHLCSYYMAGSGGRYSSDYSYCNAICTRTNNRRCEFGKAITDDKFWATKMRPKWCPLVIVDKAALEAQKGGGNHE